MGILVMYRCAKGTQNGGNDEKRGAEGRLKKVV